jgi:serine/threonine-protein kinase RsbW
MSGLAEVFTLRSEMAEGAELTKWVLGVCSKYSLPDEVAFALQLCLDEAVANIIEHGKTHGRGATEISVSIAREDKGIVMKVVDDSDEFDPTQFEPLPSSRSLAEPAVGGLGIHLMRKFATALRYQRTDRRNHLHFLFALPR